jgi:hypothetical protein
VAGSDPIVTDTGCTVTLLHRVYLVRYPDGTTEDLIPVQCKRTSEDERAWVLARARATWRRRQRETA